ncbi:MAG TPA: alpha/beta hydrolase, partial [Acidimicrobiia bacterium]|nr:alpha/beta hydrolase [Acidimicrobiia bacterium]
ILFVHGIFGDADAWTDQAARLSDRYTCVRYDRRGYTRTTRGNATVTDALHADDAAALIEALGLAPCLVVASSSGAAIAVDVALRYPRLLRGAVVSEPPLFSIDPDAGQALMSEVGPRIDDAMATGGPPAGVDAFLSTVCPGLWSIVDDDRKASYRANADIGFTDLQSPSTGASPAQLSTVEVPVLVLSGSRSHTSFRSVAHRLAAGLPDARFVELDGSGHVTYAEQPDAFENAVRVFAAELDRRGTTAST